MSLEKYLHVVHQYVESTGHIKTGYAYLENTEYAKSHSLSANNNHQSTTV